MIALAHAGGWDDLAIFVGVGILAVVVVRRAERKARRSAGEEGVAVSEQPPEDAGPAPEGPG